MAARSIGNGTVCLGLVTVPVKLYSAAEASSGVSFNFLHAKCGSRVKQQYICPRDSEVLARDQMVKGYEFAKDQYVIFTDDELRALAEESTPAIEIAEFLPLGKVDPIYFQDAYYLGPDKGGERPYALLAAAMRQTGRAALARWAARGKGYLVLIRAASRGLVMQILHYAGEVRSCDEIPIGDTVVKPGELKLAVQLVKNISSEAFRPEAYQDEVTKRQLQAIQRKVDGHEVAFTNPEAPRAKVVNLMQALKASLSKTGKPGRRKAARSSPGGGLPPADTPRVAGGRARG